MIYCHFNTLRESLASHWSKPSTEPSNWSLDTLTPAGTKWATKCDGYETLVSVNGGKTSKNCDILSTWGENTTDIFWFWTETPVSTLVINIKCCLRQDIKLLREDKLGKSFSAPPQPKYKSQKKRKMSWSLFVLNHNNINVHHVLLQQQSLNLTFNDFFLTLPSFSSVQSSQVWISFEFRFGLGPHVF